MKNNFKPIKLNVGGRHFITYYDTLKQSAYFRSLLQNKKEAQAIAIGYEEDQSFFIDRDGEVFKDVLHYLRSFEIPRKPQQELKILKKEAEFFKVDDLIAILDKALHDIIVEQEDNVSFSITNGTSRFHDISYRGSGPIKNANTSSVLWKISYTDEQKEKRYIMVAKSDH